MRNAGSALIAQREHGSPQTVYTIGHSNHTLDAFLDLLRLHDIEVLIDTRSAPYSRYSPQFNRDALKAAVQDAGMRYGFYGRELGGRPEGADLYDAAGHVIYTEVARSLPFQNGLTRLKSGVEQFRVVLLCSEENPNVCHRHLLVSRALDEQGIAVFHIRGDGHLESEQALQESEARVATERQNKAETKRLAAECKLQAAELRHSVRRELREQRMQKKLQEAQASTLLRLEKKCQRQAEAGQKLAERDRHFQERARLAVERKAQVKAKHQIVPICGAVFTIGFTQSSAAHFFERLRTAGIRRLLDVRLNNSSQLAGFAKRDDLKFFLRELCSIEYVYEPLLAPTQEMLDSYRKKGENWMEYERQFLDLLAQRQVEVRLDRAQFATATVLLCSEATTEHCHRRLALEYLQQYWPELEVTHL